MLPGETAEEGPFGEFTGFYGPKGQRPVIQIKAITFRDEPVFLGAYCGKPPQETNLIYSFSVAAEVVRSVPIPGVKQVNVTQSGFTAIVSTTKPCEGYGKMMGLAVLGTWAGRLLKTVIVVDEDVDPFSWDEVEWAIATRVQPHRDVSIITELPGIVLDPSLPAPERVDTARTSKMIIDATKYNAERYEPYCVPSAEALAFVDSRWEEYGIPLGQAAQAQTPAVA
jgi:UbiD family decarboxylase